MISSFLIVVEQCAVDAECVALQDWAAPDRRQHRACGIFPKPVDQVFDQLDVAPKRLNCHTATVVELDPADGTMLVERQQDGQRQRLDLKHLADRHVRPGWVQTIHAAQGATAERVMAHMESFRTNTVDTRAAYVAISRARSHAALYTDSRARLAEALGLRDGAQVGAIDEIMGRNGSFSRHTPLVELDP